jgi:carboxyl-terminal processing protease
MLWKLFGCLTAIGMSLCLPNAAWPQPLPNAVTGHSESLVDSMARGRALEIDRRWQEAIQLYEKLHRKNPQHQEIETRLQVVRVRFDVSRRYSDRSFVLSTERMSPAAALDLASEILTKLQLYYVEPLDFQALLRNGTAFLEVALTEPEFLKENVSPSVRPEAIEHFRVNVHKVVSSQRPAANIQDVRQAVLGVANHAREKIGLPPTAVIYEYLCGFVGLLDPYSAYLTGSEYREIMSQIEGNLIGIGVELWAEGDDLRIVEVFRGAPSEEAGLRKGDRIVDIGGVSVIDVGAKRAADLLRGPENSSVRIVFEREKANRGECTIKRRRVDVPSVSAVRIVDKAAGIGYLRISNFQRTTPTEVDSSLRSLHTQGMKCLILDLRRNPGGLLDAAVEIADRFLPSGKIVSTRGRNGQENRTYSAEMPGTWDLPLMVLIDEDSASASEIFAGAIYDQNRGLVVGRTSYGKGSVQGVFQNELTEGGIRLTISKFFSPAGTAISARGITPHYSFDDPAVANLYFSAKLQVSTDNPNGAPAPRNLGSAGSSSGDNASSDSDEEADLLRAIEIARTEFYKTARRR